MNVLANEVSIKNGNLGDSVEAFLLAVAANLDGDIGKAKIKFHLHEPYVSIDVSDQLNNDTQKFYD